MKRIYFLITTVMLSLLSIQWANAQSRSVKVNVQDAYGAVPGASVFVKGTTNGDVTDFDGNTTIHNVQESSVLVISYIGMATQEIAVGTLAEIKVVLKEDTETLEETVVVGYGTQKKESLTSAITSVRAEDVTKTKQNDVVTALQGKVPGLLIRQSGGTPGSMGANLSLRGYGAPLIVIDGVVRSDSYTNSNKGISTDLEFSQLNPEDIESISVLKDASASVYGLGAGNGVIMITTKKGQAMKKPSVNYSNVFSFGKPKMPKEVGIADYLKLSNEMADMAKFNRPYTDEQIAAAENGTLENFSWWDAAMRDHSTTQTHNLSVRGGTDRISYFLSGSFNDDKSIYNTDDNFKYRRFTLRGNFTFKLTDDLTVDYQTSFRATSSADPANDDVYNEKSAMIFNYIAFSDRLTPATVKGNPNHYTYQGQSPTENPIAMMDHDLNYTDKRGRAYTNTLNVNYVAPFLKGLRLSLQGAYDFNYDGTYTKKTIYPLYDYETDVILGYGGDENSYRESIRERERLYGRAQATFDRTFAEKHHVTAMAAAELTKLNTRRQTSKRLFGDFFTHPTVSSGLPGTDVATGTRTSTATAGYLARVNYEYDNRYLVEVMARYDGTYLYQKGKRWGFFPSYSLGWRISEEPFIKNNAPWISSLKLRWSDGKTGLTQGSAYAYESGYVSGNSYVFTPGSSVLGYVNNEIANTILSWADIRLMNIGLDWNLWRDKFSGTFDMFERMSTGLAGRSSGSTPTILGVTEPQINIDSRKTVGMELSLSHRNKIKDFTYYVTGTATIARTMNLHVESQATSQYYSSMNYYGAGFIMNGSASTQGRWTDYHGLWKYGLEGGRFTNWEDIYDSGVKYDANTGMQTTVIGQYKLLDWNNDGYITAHDVIYTWAEANPPLQFGLNLGFEYKGFDVNMVWQGATMTSKIIWLLHTFGYGGYNNIYEMYLDRYHVANQGDDPYDPKTEWVEGYWPALMDSSDANNWRPGMYDAPSDFTQIDATYFRLKSFEIGYTLPRKLTSTIGLRSARVFLGGTNWLTLTNKKIKYYDPESAAAMQSNTMPVMRTVTCGLNINF
ncbi:MAG: SusC/RagA family TonB-linked outer membrane protein [Candidatus Cryptobacteroides sp.]|nr:SusC/RagA family TonB-linked outer membrane protein [Bacteroidales bacterium]MDD7010954.1 SusC/RagA family TonB-linked outer membrane protein [Bacteroidales bacterium]MDY6158170.1 SusC/RagA family TonB-linked outer membrane protein [Candidatus Cryptobacteroides sp.]